MNGEFDRCETGNGKLKKGQTIWTLLMIFNKCFVIKMTLEFLPTCECAFMSNGQENSSNRCCFVQQLNDWVLSHQTIWRSSKRFFMGKIIFNYARVKVFLSYLLMNSVKLWQTRSYGFRIVISFIFFCSGFHQSDYCTPIVMFCLWLCLINWPPIIISK